MSKKTIRFISVFLAAFMMCGGLIASFAENDNTSDKLAFNNGQLKIVVFADCQDDSIADGRMIKMINDALDAEKPDLVVFTGDNVSQGTAVLNRAAIRQIIDPIEKRGIPFAVTFGNHDGEHYSKEKMLEFYRTFNGCLSYDADPELTGTGTCNIPVYSSNGDEIAYNIWMIDSNMYDSENGGYDHVHADQIEWYKKTSEALEAQVGKKVNSMMFQHIVVPEVMECLKDIPEVTDENVKVYNGKNYILELNDNASGYLGEFPCPATVNGGQFDAICERGDVVGIVTGHDHINSFIGSYAGVDFIQIPACTFQSYGSDEIRGYGVITINEDDTSAYEAHSVRYVDMYSDQSEFEKLQIQVLGFFNNVIYIFSEIRACVQELLGK